MFLTNFRILNLAYEKKKYSSFTLYIRTQRRYHRISRKTKIWNNAFLFSWDFNKGIICRFVLLNCDTKSVKSSTARMYEHQLQNSKWGQSICQISFTETSEEIKQNPQFFVPVFIKPWITSNEVQHRTAKHS